MSCMPRYASLGCRAHISSPCSSTRRKHQRNTNLLLKKTSLHPCSNHDDRHRAPLTAHQAATHDLADLIFAEAWGTTFPVELMLPFQRLSLTTLLHVRNLMLLHQRLPHWKREGTLLVLFIKPFPSGRSLEYRTCISLTRDLHQLLEPRIPLSRTQALNAGGTRLHVVVLIARPPIPRVAICAAEVVDHNQGDRRPSAVCDFDTAHCVLTNLGAIFEVLSDEIVAAMDGAVYHSLARRVLRPLRRFETHARARHFHVPCERRRRLAGVRVAFKPERLQLRGADLLGELGLRQNVERVSALKHGEAPLVVAGLPVRGRPLRRLRFGRCRCRRRSRALGGLAFAAGGSGIHPFPTRTSVLVQHDDVHVAVVALLLGARRKSLRGLRRGRTLGFAHFFWMLQKLWTVRTTD
mmetsp:Transcript_53808/g.163411  ORF Transcript_53808/g.163411 Transcript_53808/m.163411 type:complete len:408 (-) Transcript_53808:5-1228(-)